MSGVHTAGPRFCIDCAHVDNPKIPYRCNSLHKTRDLVTGNEWASTDRYVYGERVLANGCGPTAIYFTPRKVQP